MPNATQIGDIDEWTEQGSVHPLLLQELRHAAEVELGVRAKILFEAFNLDERVSILEAQGIWRAIEAFDEAQDLGARLGRHYRTSNYADVVTGALSLSCALPRWADASAQFYPFLSTGATISLEAGEAPQSGRPVAKIVCSFGVGRRGRVVRQATLRATLSAIRTAVAADVVPASVRLTLRQSDESLQRLHSLFGCPVQSATGEDALVFPASLLELPVASLPNAMHTFRDFAVQLTALQQQRDSLQHRVVNAIQHGLPDAFTIDGVAGAFGWSVRTLQRELNREGLTFREICRKTRKALALDYLASGCAVEQTARLVGYSNVTAFSRVYHNVIGRGPAQGGRRRRGATLSG